MASPFNKSDAFSTKFPQLFSAGSHLSDVPPDFRGVPLKAWRMAQITAQAASPASQRYWERMYVNGRPRLADAKIWTPRDSYGMKGV